MRDPITNEELCARIQDGERDLIPDLWEQVRKLYDLKASQFYTMHEAQCRAAGAELDDLRQTAFFGFLQSVEAYDRESGLTFAAYIKFPLLRVLSEAAGIRGAQARTADALRVAVSLDSEIRGEKGENVGTLADCVPDPSALDFVESLDAESVGQMIRDEVAALMPAYRETVERYYFRGEDMPTQADRRGLSAQRISQLLHRGLQELAKRPALRNLYAEQCRTDSLRELESASRNGRGIASGAAADYAAMCAQIREQAERERQELDRRAAEALASVRDLLAIIRTETASQ